MLVICLSLLVCPVHIISLATVSFAIPRGGWGSGVVGGASKGPDLKAGEAQASMWHLLTWALG